MCDIFGHCNLLQRGPVRIYQNVIRLIPESTYKEKTTNLRCKRLVDNVGILERLLCHGRPRPARCDDVHTSPRRNLHDLIFQAQTHPIHHCYRHTYKYDSHANEHPLLTALRRSVVRVACLTELPSRASNEHDRCLLPVASLRLLEPTQVLSRYKERRCDVCPERRLPLGQAHLSEGHVALLVERVVDHRDLHCPEGRS